MIDLHSHILPQIDDGSRSAEETFVLLSEAASVGFTDIIFTPHFIEGYYDKNAAEICALANAIKAGCEKKNIQLNLYTGNELYFSKNIVHLIKSGNASSLNESRYALFEFPLQERPMDLFECIYALQEYKYVPVLAHPERYPFIQKEPELIYEFAKAGVLFQCNYCSILGQYGKKAKLIVEKMLEADLVSFLGSDVHRKNTIYPKIPLAMKKIESIVGKRKLKAITESNQKTVIENGEVNAPEAKEIKLSFFDKMILNHK